MEGLNVEAVVSGLQAVTSGQPRALEQLVTQHAKGMIGQLVPATVAQAASLVPFDLENGSLAFAPHKLEGALRQVLGRLSPDALRALQHLTQLAPGGLAGLVSSPDAVLHQDWLGRIGNHLLQEAMGPELQQFAHIGQQVQGLLASANPHLPLAGALTSNWNPGHEAAPPAEAAPKNNDKEGKPAVSKSPVRTGWLDLKKEQHEQLMELADRAEKQSKRVLAQKLPPRGQLYGMIGQHLGFFQDHTGTFGMSRGTSMGGGGLVGVSPSRTTRYYNRNIQTDSVSLSVKVEPFSTSVSLTGGQTVNLGVEKNWGAISSVLDGLSAASMNPMVVWQLQALKKILPGDFQLGLGGAIQIGQSNGKWYTRLNTTRKLGYKVRGAGGSLSDMRSIQLTEDHFKYLGLTLPGR